MESTKLGSTTLSRFPQMRLPPTCLSLLSAVPPSSLMPCLRWWPVIAVNSSRILPLSFLDACWYRSRIVSTSSCFAILLMPPPT